MKINYDNSAKKCVIYGIDKVIDEIFDYDENYYENGDGMKKEMQDLIEKLRKFQWKIELYFDENGNNK